MRDEDLSKRLSILEKTVNQLKSTQSIGKDSLSSRIIPCSSSSYDLSLSPGQATRYTGIVVDDTDHETFAKPVFDVWKGSVGTYASSSDFNITIQNISWTKPANKRVFMHNLYNSTASSTLYFKAYIVINGTGSAHIDTTSTYWD